MPTLTGTGQIGSQVITCDGTAGAGLIELQYAFWVETPDVLSGGLTGTLSSQFPGGYVHSIDTAPAIFLGDGTTSPAASGQMVFMSTGPEAYFTISVTGAGAATYGYSIDYVSHG